MDPFPLLLLDQYTHELGPFTHETRHEGVGEDYPDPCVSRTWTIRAGGTRGEEETGGRSIGRDERDTSPRALRKEKVTWHRGRVRDGVGSGLESSHPSLSVETGSRPQE